MKSNTTTEEVKNETFDADGFKASVLDEVNKMIQGVAKDWNKNLEKQFAKLQTSAPEPKPNDDQGNKGNPSISAEVNAELQKRDRELSKLTESVSKLTQERDTERTARMESERVSAIKDAMSTIQFRDDVAARSLFKIVNPDIVRDEDGNIVAKTDKGFLPVDDYVKTTAESLPGLLAAQGRGGSGATPGKTATKGYTFDDIKPGNTPEKNAEILRYIQSVANV